MIGRTITHYRILEPLGEGAMGIVYKAEDLNLGRTVAMKLLSPELTRNDDAKQRFLIEARAASQLDHPNICTVHEAGETGDGHMFLVMSYYEGETLATKLKRGPLAVKEAVDIARQIASGLAQAHERGIIHRDIKPANVVVTSDGVAKILDFGVAKLSGSTVTRTGTWVGTIAYMSPEQLLGEQPTPASDLWSVGVLLYELLTGRRPFDGPNEPTVILSVINKAPVPISDLAPAVPGEVAIILDALLRKSPSDRYDSADALIADLRALSFGDGAETAVKPSTRSLSPSALRIRARISRDRRFIVAILAIVALCVAGALFLGRRGATVSPRGVRVRSAAGRTMIAVLPFRNLGRADDAVFADGITEEIISRLATVEQLGVISRTSVYAYDREGRSAPQIGAALGVTYILEGTVQWERAAGKNRVRVTPQLIRVSDDTHVWSDRYDRELADVFAVQSDIAERVIRQLGVRLAEGSNARKPTANVGAYELFLRAVPARWTYAEPEIRAGIVLAEQAVAADPEFAAAHALAGYLHVRLYHHGFDRSATRLALARGSIDRALAIDPANAEARIARGYYDYWADHDYERALAEFSEARRVRPGDTSLLAGIAYAHRRQGKPDQALAELLEVQKLDPRNATVAGEIAMTYASLRRFDDADRVLREGTTAFPQATLLYTLRFATRLAANGSISEARALLQASPHSAEETAVAARYSLAMCEGRADDALDAVRTSAVTTFVTAPTRNMLGAAHYPKELLVAYAERLVGREKESRASFDAARVLLERAVRETPDDDSVHAALGLVYAGLGRNADAIREAESGARLRPPERDAVEAPTRLIELAQVYAEAGQPEKAVGVIERVLGMPALFTVPLLRVDPAWDPLRSNARFQELIARR